MFAGSPCLFQVIVEQLRWKALFCQIIYHFYLNIKKIFAERGMGIKNVCEKTD